MRNFFRSLEQRHVRYLLISGQASVLYGASQFSEDIDLWVEPTAANIRKLILVLRDVHAALYKLTPPLTVFYCRRGHGFHFRLPAEEFDLAYLDIMGKPPRVGSFNGAFRRARRIDCDWGKIPVVAIRDLVEMKKTQRLADYDVISNPVRIQLSQIRQNLPTLAWALQNIFRVEDAIWILKRWPQARHLIPQTRRKWLTQLASGRSITPEKNERIQISLAEDIAKHQHQDVVYWSRIIQELKDLRKKRMLLPVGISVSDLR